MKTCLQNEAAECSLACLVTVASAHRLDLDLHEIRKRFPVSLKGVTLAQLVGFASALEFDARPLRLELDELGQLACPCILHWDLNHFVVLKRVRRGVATIVDPAVGERRLAMAEVSRHFTGVALELTPSASFKPADRRERLALRSLTGRVSGLGHALLQILGVSAALELFAIAAPMVNQWVVDDAIAAHDRSLLTLLATGFGILLLIQTALGLARGWMTLALGQSLSLQWSGNLFTHLVKLPVDFFEKRHLGDILSRVGSAGAIQSTLTTGAIEALLDGLMGVAAFVMMALYSRLLAAIVLAAVAAYALLRWAFYKPLRDAAAERLIVSARENTVFMETLRAVVPLKLFGREDERLARWRNLRVEVQNRDVRTARMSMLFGGANTLVFGLQNLAVLWVGGRAVIDSGPGAAFTVGMLFAFMSYQAQFTSRAAALVNYVVDIRMLGLHAERLADIALAAPEADRAPAHDLAHLPCEIRLRHVSFRYSEGEPWILRDVSLRLGGDESIALIGASGCGKTTLLKIALGLLVPTEGDVLYGGVPLRQIGLRNYRRLVGTVMQEDVLLAGSIADNISFFDLSPDADRVRHCAAQASIHADILAMPMGYETLVGEMGSSLSGGQKQRVLLARALYKNPRILALDEATSHLDIQNERLVNDAFAQMKLLRIMVAHRPQTIAGAQRILRLADGKVSEIRRVARPSPPLEAPGPARESSSEEGA